MIKLSGSVGRMGLNKKHDVALVQKTFGAIKTKTRFGMKPLWPKKPDGRNSRDLEAAIVCFQDSHKIKASGKLECTAQTMNALTRALPFSMRDQASVQGTSAAVRGPSDPGRESFRIAAETVAKAPFPLSERKTLARAYRSLGPGHNICLSRKKDWVTNDGRFATELEIDGELSGTLAERNQVHQIICRFITSQGVWEKGNPNDLKFRSKRQLKCLKGLGTGSLSADDKKLLGITTPPREAVLLACAKGCARLISSGNIAKPEGKKEAEIIIDAASNADPVLGKALKAAVEEKKGPFEFTNTTLQNLDNALASLPGRLSAAISSLNEPSQQTLSIVEKFFKPNKNFPFLRIDTPEDVAQILLGTLKRVERQLGFVNRKKFILRFSLNPIQVVEVKFKDPSVVAVAYQGNIYLDQSRFNGHNPVTHAAVVLHETVHLALSAGAEKEDFRSIWQGVEGLSAEDALNNADSIVAFVFHDVLGAIGRYTVPRP